jgi:quercetin dioxygenase-like cupin family protein
VRRTLLLVVCLGAIGLFAGALSRASQADPLDPITVAADSHKLAFENAFVRVLDVHIAPGKSEPRHRHPHGLSIYLTDWDAKVTNDGGQPETRHRSAGTFAWSDAIVHTVQNVGKTEAHNLRVELKF